MCGRVKSEFLDALASLGSMLESDSVSNVDEIWSNLGHIFRICLEYVQSMFRVQSVFRVCSRYFQSRLRVGSE